MNNLQYARCIDCTFFGTHGAYCDLMDCQMLCFYEACVMFQWKKENALRHMDPAYFFPFREEERTEMRLRGMEVRGCR